MQYVMLIGLSQNKFIARGWFTPSNALSHMSSDIVEATKVDE